MGVLEEQRARIEENEKHLKALCPKYENLLRVAACFLEQCKRQEEELKKWEDELNMNDLLRDWSDVPKILKSKGEPYNPDAFIEIVLGMDCIALQTHTALTKALASAGALKRANAGHDQKGGSRDKQERICQLWATGKYKSRTQCAKDECSNLGMSYDTARRALLNTPDPT